MKFSVTTYSFNQALREGRMTQLDTITAAKDLGFDAIEFSVMHLPEGETPLSYAPILREACEKMNLPICGYLVGADFLKRGLDEQVRLLKEEVRAAAAMGTHLLRHDASSGFPNDYTGARSFDAALPILAEGYRQVTQYAKTLGVQTVVENHGYFVQDAQRVEKLVCAVNDENFGALVDIGNFMCADEDPVVSVAIMAPYAKHVHVKDFHQKSGMASIPAQGWFPTRAGNYLRGAILGHGEVPVPQCLRTLKKAGYDGYVTIEFEGMEDCMLGAKLGLEYLKSIAP